MGLIIYLALCNVMKNLTYWRCSKKHCEQYIYVELPSSCK